MPKTIPEYEELVAGHLQDGAEKLAAVEVVKAIEEAIAGRYSKDRPRKQVTDLTGDGATYEWSLAGVSGWQEGFSRVIEIEYPEGERSPVYLEGGEWLLYAAPAGRFLRFAMALSTGKKARVRFTAAHAVDASTVPDADFYAVGALAASLAARRLAALHAQTGDSSIAADTVNYRTKSQEYMALARQLEKQYENLLGTDPERSAPASSRTEAWQGRTAGGERLTH
jgi:hypothetical protein